MATKRARGSRLPVRGDPFLTLHVLIYPEDDLWMAHCLELDAVAQGDSPDQARAGLMDAVAALVTDARANGDLAALFRPAPVELWQRFGQADGRTLHVNLAPSGAPETAGKLPSACIEERLVPA